MPRNRLFARPRLNPLDDRTTPATFAVTTTLDLVNPADGRLSLREAVTAANARPGADTIVLPAGTFPIAIAGGEEDGNATGDFDVTDPVTVRGAGGGYTVLDARQKDRLFDVIGSFPATFVGLTLRHGAGPVNGGAINAATADVTLVRCVVSDNLGLAGGGVNAETGHVTLVGTAILRNVAQGDGGGVRVGSSILILKGSSVRGNLAHSGGGISALTAGVTNSRICGNSAATDGGGISSGSVTLTGSTVSGNAAGGHGGGIFDDLFGSAVLIRSTVSSNTAAAGGGVLGGHATLTDSTVIANAAAGGAGGGILAFFNAILTGSTVRNNAAAGGNGGGINSNSVEIVRSTVAGNSAGIDGGGIFAGTATLDGSTVSGNLTSREGGGIAASIVTVTNGTVSGNAAGGSGGGVAAFAGVSLRNCTVAGNSAGGNGGGVFCSLSPTQPVEVTNSIIARNFAGPVGTGPDAFGAFISLGHNLIGDGTGATGFTDGINGDLVGTAADPIDPKLGPLANNGGPTQTMALLAGSPAIDAGDNAGLPVTTDQRGRPRVKDGNGDGRAVIDIGAFER